METCGELNITVDELLSGRIAGRALTDVVDPFKDNGCAGSSLVDGVAVKTIEGPRSKLGDLSILQDSVSADPRIQHGERDMRCIEPVLLKVGVALLEPDSAEVLDQRGASALKAVGDGIPESHD